MLNLTNLPRSLIIHVEIAVSGGYLFLIFKECASNCMMNVRIKYQPWKIRSILSRNAASELYLGKGESKCHYVGIIRVKEKSRQPEKNIHGL